MPHHSSPDHSGDTTPNPQRDPLHQEWLDTSRAFEQKEAEEYESLNHERTEFEKRMSHKHEMVDLIREIELERIRDLRSLRHELDIELLAAHNVASVVFAVLGLEYIPGIKKVEDLFKTYKLPEAVAAKKAGVPFGTFKAGPTIKFLKFCGLAGCLTLGTVGMGSLLLHVQPRALFHSPMLPVAVGLAFILVGGTYLADYSAGRRHGALAAGKPGDPATKRSSLALSLLVAAIVIIVAIVDAESLVAMNATRAMVNPEANPSFIVTFLVAAGLNAAYCLGTAVYAYNEGFAFVAQRCIEAEQDLHQENYRQEQKELVEVTQACEAMNSVAVIERRRKELNDEIDSAEAALRRSSAEAYGDMEAPPELSQAQRRRIGVQKQKSRFSTQKLNAFDALRAKLRTKQRKPAVGGAA